jgi:hypothetical protein
VEAASTADGRGGSAPWTIRVAAPAELPGRLTELGLGGARPVMVLVGGADRLDEADLARLRPLFDEGLAPLVDALGAGVVDGGTDAGVMALMGQARAKLGATFPLIGVAADGTVDTTTATATRRDAVAVEPNHSHAVLVPGATWGDESPWLAAVAAVLAGEAPSVTVIVNGGEVTLDDAARSVEANRPVVVLAGSGRTADALAAALAREPADKRVAALAASGLLQAVDLADGPPALARAVAALLAGAPAALTPSTGSYEDWLKADFSRLIGELPLSGLRRRFLQSRWLEQLLWVEQRATHDRDRYYLWRLLTIVGGVLVPALVTLNLTGPSRVATIWATFAISLLVAVSAAIETFFRYGERWRHYRRTAELLKTEGWQFFQLTGHYRRFEAHHAAFPVFASRIEDVLQQDVDAYVTTVAAEPAGKQVSRPDGPAPP